MFNNKYNTRRWIYGMILGSLLTWLFMGHAHAQTISVATGDPKGTYSAVFKEINSRCGNGEVKEVNSAGSNDNVDKLVANQTNAAIVQADVLVFRSRTEDLSKIGTLFTLHQEQVHFIARADGVKVGGFYGIGGTELKFNSVTDLKGRSVGAAGGSVLTAKVINAQAGLGYAVKEYANNEAALQALQNKEVDAVVAVIGAPAKAIEALPGTYKILPIPTPVQDKLKSVYEPARVSYRNLNASGVQTVGIRSVLVSREYKSAKYNTVLSNYRACFLNNIDDMQDQVGLPPAFQTVDKKDQGHWKYLTLQ